MSLTSSRTVALNRTRCFVWGVLGCGIRFGFGSGDACRGGKGRVWGSFVRECELWWVSVNEVWCGCE